jgi:hypothetical protein
MWRTGPSADCESKPEVQRDFTPASSRAATPATPRVVQYAAATGRESGKVRPWNDTRQSADQIAVGPRQGVEATVGAVRPGGSRASFFLCSGSTQGSRISLARRRCCYGLVFSIRP